MKKNLQFILILFSLNTYSQSNGYIIKFCPLSLIDEGTFPSIQGGLEIKVSDRLTWYNEIGIKYKKSSYEGADTSFVKSSGLRAKSELRYYYKRTESTLNAMEGGYIGINVFFNKDHHDSEIEYYHKKDSTILYADNIGVRKNIFGLNVVTGFQKTIIKHFLLDVYAGIGIRLKFIRNISQEYDSNKDDLVTPIDITIQGVRKGMDVDNGFSGIANLTLGFRLCYKF